MTLCIAEKRGDLVTFVSDSRISFSDGNFIDFGVKIFRLPVVIRSAICSETGQSELLYDHALGICVIGSSLNSYLVKETVFEILQNLQYVGFSAEFSMESFCKIIARVYEKFSRDICSIFDKKGIAQLVVGGFCPDSKCVRVFHFELDDTSFPVTAKVTEILKEAGVQFFGSGAKRANEIYSLNPTDCFHILRDVIHDSTISSVGGPLQSGVFEERQFRIKGVQDYLLSEFGMFEYHHSLRGINLYDKEFEQFNLGFHVSYEFLAPFRRDMKQQISERFPLHGAENGRG